MYTNEDSGIDGNTKPYTSIISVYCILYTLKLVQHAFSHKMES